MNISTKFLTNYLLDRDFDWEAFQAFSTMAAHKKDKIIADWRFGDEMDAEDVKKIFKVFEKFLKNNMPIEGLSYDEFMKDYVKKNDQQF
ncbi:MAG: hypothetical protein IT234_00020 [Bacteroidia bacterium]|nr:hypothetical protein [Bacteroidia bacterium]